MDLILTSVLLIFITIYEIKFFLYHENVKIRDPDLKGFALIEMVAYAAGKEAGKAEEQSEKK